MEKKRKLPPRAAARSEHVSKKRNMTPQRSVTPAAAIEAEPVFVDEGAALPKSISAGKPLPTLETAQPHDLSNKDYQTVPESGVLAESLNRSRQSLILSEGMFEKYWTKPHKRRGQLVEEPNNPPKESMTKLGVVQITIEPHVFEATLFAVKDPKPTIPPSNVRPKLQYGPPNAVMSPDPAVHNPAPSSTSATSPTLTPAPTSVAPVQAPSLAKTVESSSKESPTLEATQAQTSRLGLLPEYRSERQPPPTVTSQGHAASTQDTPVLSPTTGAPALAGHGPHPKSDVIDPVLSPSTSSAPPVAPAVSSAATTPQPSSIGDPSGTVTIPQSGPAMTSALPATNPVAKPQPNGISTPGCSTPANGTPANGTDPIILTLAERAGEDPHLRDLMRKVAHGDASKTELEVFQTIIDSITAESKWKGTPGPSADRLLILADRLQVGGRSMRWFADEVRQILDIVLSSYAKTTSANLGAPKNSDPLVVALVKKALDEAKTKDMIKRIAENRPHFTDAQELKSILEQLQAKIVKDQPTTTPTPVPETGFRKANGVAKSVATHPPATGQSTTKPQSVPQQALRSKGPPPPSKQDMSAIVVEFTGGTGDRYLFPKYSILEYKPAPTGQQVIASFLIVRKGSKSEYPMADPELDYYQPMTIRLYAHVGRQLEYLSKVVAPQEEVRRYMNDVMGTMTRAEYVLLAMRLPRTDKEEAETEDREKSRETAMNGVASRVGDLHATNSKTSRLQNSVLWSGTKPLKSEIKEMPPRPRKMPVTDPDIQYQNFIASVSRKEIEEA